MLILISPFVLSAIVELIILPLLLSTLIISLPAFLINSVLIKLISFGDPSKVHPDILFSKIVFLIRVSCPNQVKMTSFFANIFPSTIFFKKIVLSIQSYL